MNNCLPSFSSDEIFDKSIALILMNIGFKPNFFSFKYLVVCIRLATLHPEYLHELYKSLYTKVSNIFNVPVNRIARSVSMLIYSTWDNNKLLNVNKVLKCNIYSKYDYPKATEFISLMVWFFTFN